MEFVTTLGASLALASAPAGGFFASSHRLTHPLHSFPMTSLTLPTAPRTPRLPLGVSRNLMIPIGVVLLHVGALWALQTGLLQRMVDLVVPAEILVEIMAPSAAPAPPRVAQPRQPSPTKPTPVPTTPSKAAVVAPAPVPLAVADTHPTPASALAPAPVAAAAAPVAAAPAGPSAAAPTVTAPSVPKLELPSSDADYLHNPKPPYPPLSKRLGEQGNVLVRTLIGADGVPQKAEIKQSSGFDRLDQAALATALRWRYVPGKRAGVPETMWFNVPFSFVLE